MICAARVPSVPSALETSASTQSVAPPLAPRTGTQRRVPVPRTGTQPQRRIHPARTGTKPQRRIDRLRSVPRAAAAASAPHARLGSGVVLTGLVLAGVGAATHSSLMLAPFVATASLVHAAPHSPAARSRNIVGGHVIGASLGVAAGVAFGASALAVVGAAGLVAVLLMALDLDHPPAVAMAVVALQTPTPSAIGIALLGALTMAATVRALAPALHRR